jgi:hypothetical protein
MKPPQNLEGLTNQQSLGLTLPWNCRKVSLTPCFDLIRVSRAPEINLFLLQVKFTAMHGYTGRFLLVATYYRVLVYRRHVLGS